MAQGRPGSFQSAGSAIVLQIQGSRLQARAPHRHCFPGQLRSQRGMSAAVSPLPPSSSSSSSSSPPQRRGAWPSPSLPPSWPSCGPSVRLLPCPQVFPAAANKQEGAQEAELGRGKWLTTNELTWIPPALRPPAHSAPLVRQATRAALTLRLGPPSVAIFSTCATNCWTFLLFFLFFKPKVCGRAHSPVAVQTAHKSTWTLRKRDTDSGAGGGRRGGGGAPATGAQRGRALDGSPAPAAPWSSRPPRRRLGAAPPLRSYGPLRTPAPLPLREAAPHAPYRRQRQLATRPACSPPLTLSSICFSTFFFAAFLPTFLGGMIGCRGGSSPSGPTLAGVAGAGRERLLAGRTPSSSPSSADSRPRGARPAPLPPATPEAQGKGHADFPATVIACLWGQGWEGRGARPSSSRVSGAACAIQHVRAQRTRERESETKGPPCCIPRSPVGSSYPHAAYGFFVPQSGLRRITRTQCWQLNPCAADLAQAVVPFRQPRKRKHFPL